MHFQQFNILGLREYGNRVWKTRWMTILREIWEHRNDIIYRDALEDVVDIFVNTQLKAWT